MNVSRQSFQATEKRIVLQWAMTISVIANKLVSESKTKNKHKLVPNKNLSQEAEIVLEHLLI